MSSLTLIYKCKNRIANKIIFMLKKIHVASGVNINGIITIIGDGEKIFIGEGTRISSGYRANPIGGSTRTILSVASSGKIVIGNNCGVSNSAIVSNVSVTIEDDVFIGGNCKIYDTDFHSIQYENRMRRPDNTVKSAPILIKRGAFVGAHSIILKGVTIGEKSIIGAGAVVTKDVPDFEVWGGNPAQFIRKIDK